MNGKTCGLWDTWTRGRGTYESGTLSRGSRERGARAGGGGGALGHEDVKEDSPSCGTISLSTRGRDKQTPLGFCSYCLKYNFLWCPIL